MKRKVETTEAPEAKKQSLGLLSSSEFWDIKNPTIDQIFSNIMFEIAEVKKEFEKAFLHDEIDVLSKTIIGEANEFKTTDLKMLQRYLGCLLDVLEDDHNWENYKVPLFGARDAIVMFKDGFTEAIGNEFEDFEKLSDKI